ncbi:MAG: 4Fe-4S binding protein [Candidatus Heimdallarchaeaceae archaeon]
MTTTHKLKLSSPLRPILNKKIRIIRTIVQFIMFGLFNGLIFGLSRVAIAIPVAFPTGGPFSTTWNAFEALQYMLSFMIFPYLIISIFALFGSILGKTTCGWACPFGLFQDLFRYLPFKKKKVSRPTNQSLSKISATIVVFVLLISFIIGSSYHRTGDKHAFGVGKDMPFSTIDPASTLFATLYYYLKWGLSSNPLGDQITSWRFLFILRILIFIIVLVLMALYPRAYCRWLCPTGALLGFFSKYSLLGIRRNPNRCVSGCNKCEQVCPMQVPILSYEKDVTDKLCINCLECVEACDEGALKFTLRF